MIHSCERKDNMIASSRDRVASNTRDDLNERIRRETEKNIAYYAARPDEIDQRLKELDEEWDIERALQTNASALTIFSLTMGFLGRRRWFLVAGVVPAFLLQHSLQGWCPPVNVFRALGFRTQFEINIERNALRALRGDFQDLPIDEEKQHHEGVGKLLQAMQE
jgi:hypothetical protein